MLKTLVKDDKNGLVHFMASNRVFQGCIDLNVAQKDIS